MKELRKMKKFRFQLLHTWIVENYSPCKVADIGGGKGLLTLLLNNDNFHSVVIDPYNQGLPKKFKDLKGEKHKIKEDIQIPRIDAVFEKEMAKDFDLLIGLHAHGANMKIIEVAKKYNKNFVIFPCCVIDEPIEIKPNIDWFESLRNYAKKLGHKTHVVELNFRGQNKGIYTKI